MSFSPAFGSFGDFISLSILIKDIVNALSDTHGSVADYRSLARELDIIDTVLKHVCRLCQTNSPVAEIQALHEFARKTIEGCQADLSLFTARLSKYKSSLGNNSGKLLKIIFLKLLWLKEKDGINRFRVKLIGYSGSLNMIMTSAFT